MAALALIATAGGPATPRLRQLIVDLSRTKRRMADDDPELFATFHQIATESRAAVTEHLDTLAAQLATIIAAGVESGEFAPVDAGTAGRAVLQATARFHHPAHVNEWHDPNLDADLTAVLNLLVAGLRGGRPLG